MNVAHSTWPVILMPYNLPPADCMKKSYFMLSVLIPGPSEPGNNRDVYLQPLIAELKELFEVGVTTYDASSKTNFQMRAALLWTISDFPGLASIFGWSTKGEFACSVCYKFTNSKWLDNSRKYCYMCHRIFLPDGHPYRNEKATFDGKKELRKAPPYLKGSTVLDDIKNIDNKFGKNVGDLNLPYSWKKKSILFNLPYWEKNLVRHNLDVMHIEKNVCDKVLYTLIDSDKSKDNYKARMDLKKMGIRNALHPYSDEFGKEWIPTSSFTLDKSEKERFCKVLKNVKVPDGYAANISRCVHLKPTRIFGLKSHDSHIMMQQLLPLSLRNLLPKSVRSPLIHLSRYFRNLCSKTLQVGDLTRMEKEIALILCQLEKIFPSAFFDVMVHLTVHLVTEAKLAGPVHYRWMYPVERYLSTLKSYVRNRCRPEGSIAEGYLAEECLAFCSLYFDENVETRRNRTSRNSCGGEDSTKSLDIFFMSGTPLWKGKIEELKLSEDDPKQSDVIRLARGPIPVGTRYRGFKLNGFRFHTRELERKRKTQNSGVMVNATTTSFASKKDMRPIVQEMMYYGILKNIIEFDYTGGKKIVLFDCDWVSKGRRQKENDDGFTLVNFTKIRRQSEPFVLASQVQQVFYVADPIEKDWHVVIKTKAREKFDDGRDVAIDGVDTIVQSKPCKDRPIIEDELVSWVREGVPEIPVDSLDDA
ncbi:PREDICTED: uncharacterized protein LOC105953520 [Erythranthe guttata]|uniref:uncharacterized protein LOC105953520 n=1 Tax=Erythranthe guttata TaxID=4155 RepID=UPI00064DFE39|nr:PREDICTED: uncharacterized protein LOC105953520 [Erythranthe guttata]|eukprot:XP_012832644.1 PREDICTED: uncharacterized protein LOC105953520 [Erythranthe guttata]